MIRTSRAVPGKLRGSGRQTGDEAEQVQRDVVGDLRRQPLGDAGLPVRVRPQIPHEGRAAGRAVTGRFAELGVPEHVIPVRMRREARHDGLAQLAKVVRQAGHLGARDPGVDEQHAGPALHDRGVVLEHLALVDEHTLRDLRQHQLASLSSRWSGSPNQANISLSNVRISATRPLFDPQHVHREGYVVRCAGSALVDGHRRLAVGRRGPALEISEVAPAEAGVDPGPDGLVPADPHAGLRWHREPEVVAEERGQPFDVEVLEAPDVGRNQPPLLVAQPVAGSGAPVEPAVGQVLAHRGPGPLQGTVGRGQRELEGVGRLLGRPAEHVAMDQDGPLPRGQVLDGHDERQLDGFPEPPPASCGSSGWRSGHGCR